MIWENGSSLDVDVVVEVSNKDTDARYVELPSTVTNLTTDSGSCAFSVVSGHKFMRLKITVTGGSADFSADVFSKPTTVRGA